MDAVLSADRVNEIFADCLFKGDEDTSDRVEVEGITVDVNFHPGRLANHEEEIEAMLEELPDDFKATGSGGMSFLNACMDKHGNQWTGLQQIMEWLFLLGIAIDKVDPLLPRKYWCVLPGGMPFYVVN
jgi:hypothetical protein